MNNAIQRAVVAAVTIVSVSTFILLYYGLVDLARLAGMHDNRAFLYPLAVDGVVFASYAATMHPKMSKGGVRYAWFVIAFTSILSILGQWLHAAAASGWQFAGPVAAAPALLMALVWHLLFLVARPGHVAEVETPVAEPEKVPVPNEPPGPSIVDRFREETDPPKKPRARKRTNEERLHAAVRILRTARERNQSLSGADMARALRLDNAGTPSGRKSGSRWIVRAQQVLDDEVEEFVA